MYSLIELAQVFLEAGELDEALSVLDEALAAQPTDELRRLRAAARRRLPAQDALRGALLDLQSLEAPTYDDCLEQAIVYEQLGDYDYAVMALGAAHALAKSESEYGRLAEQQVRLLLAQGDAEAALRVALTQPETWQWAERIADIETEMGDYEAAAQHYTNALAQLLAHNQGNLLVKGFRARLLLARAGALMRAGRWHEAADDYRLAEQITPDDPLIPFNRGLLAWARGEQKTALLLCRDAYLRASENIRKHMRLAVGADAHFAELRTILMI